MNIFEFVINPNDYAQSVENIFYLSFLIRDGKVAFETDEDAVPIICMYVHWISVLHKPSVRDYADPCEEPKEDDYANGLKKRQKVFEFDMAIWKVYQNLFD